MILSMRQVGVAYSRGGEPHEVLQQFSLDIAAGQAAALIGESGAGKTTAALTIPRLLGPDARITGRIELQGQDLSALKPRALRAFCGARVGFIFQDPLAAMNPALTVGAHIAEPARRHLRETPRQAWARAVALLREVGFENPAARARDYPHMFSGGMRQRAMIAAALACDPALLIADEPTSGLDPLLATQILELLTRLRNDRGMAMLLISHDLSVASRTANQVAVLQAGRCVEQGPVAEVLYAPRHPITIALLHAMPQLDAAAAPVPPAVSTALMRAESVSVRYASRVAVDSISLTLGQGECLALVGVSGAGKSSLARALLHLISYEGSIIFNGENLAALRGARFRAARRRMQMVFQNPAASLDPTQTAGAAIAEALHLSGAHPTHDSVVALLAQVGLPAHLIDRRPVTLSGGQAQRVAIARALAASPALLILDEPTASLDASTASALLALLRDLAVRSGLSYILITHDLAVAANLAHRIAVMDEGRIVEIGETTGMIAAPAHPRTQALLAAARAAQL